MRKNLLTARKLGNSTSSVYRYSGKEKFRKEAEQIDKDLKSWDRQTSRSARNKIKFAVGDEKFARDWRNSRKATYVKPEAVIKQPVVQPKASYVKPESVIKPKAVKEATVVQNKGREELVKNLRAKKALGQKLKKAGYVGLGVAGAAGLAVGAKKLYDRNKQAQQ